MQGGSTEDYVVPQVLFWKKRGEEAVQRSGIPYTIVRPGGLLNAPRQGQAAAGIVMEGPGTFGLPPKRTPGSILRSQVPRTALTWHGQIHISVSTILNAMLLQLHVAGPVVPL